MKNGGFSVKGSYHDINQDYFLCKPSENGYIMVVSDGMGSKKMSHYGSKAICEIIYDVINENKFTKKISCFEDILLLCHEEWIKRFEEYDLQECYATMLVAVISENKIRAARLGDGFLGIYANDDVKCLFDRKEGYFANETDCLCETFDKDKLEIVDFEYENLHGVIACTDGIEIGTMKEEELKAFTKELIDDYKFLNKEEIEEEFRTWIPNWIGSDDKTIAYLIEGDN